MPTRNQWIGLVLAALLPLGCTEEPASTAPPSEDPLDDPPCTELTAVIDTDVSEGGLPLAVAFDSAASCTPDEIVEAWWSFGVGGQAASGRQASFTYVGSGTYTVTLTLTDTAGQAHAATAQVTVQPGSCPEVADPVTTGFLEPRALDEPSGLAASPVHADLLWTHNDSGGDPDLHAVDASGASIAVFELLGAENEDWEDIAVGRDPATGSSTVFLWDGGDNDASRTRVAVLMVAEPSAETLAMDPSPGLPWGELELTYPEGAAYNSDTLLFDPQTGDLYVVAMDVEEEISHVFRKPAPHLAGSSTELSLVHSMQFGEEPLDGGVYPTGGSISPLGDRILLRTWDAAFLWLRDGAHPLAAAFDSPACPGPLRLEEGGEAIEFAADGRGYYSMAEEQHAPLLYSALVEPDPCQGLEARFFLSPVGSLHVPIDVTFEVDEECVTEGLDSVEWTVDGQSSDEEEPTFHFENSGTIEVSLAVTDDAGDSASSSRSIELLPRVCPQVGETETWGAVAFEDIDEASGVVASSQNDGVLWVHNDSGDTARFFALGYDGADLGTWSLDADIDDWEDLAYGFDDVFGTEVLYIGDVGDNGESRDHVTIFIVPEPEVDLESGPTSTELDEWSSMELTYPDGASHNCETLLRDPTNGDLYLVTKSSDGVSPVWRKSAPHIDGSETELEWVAELQFGSSPLSGSSNTTAGAISPQGDRIVIRTYSDAWLWHREPGQSIGEAFGGEACNVQAPDETQGEAICFSGHGDGYITVSEGDARPIYYTPLE